jgi:hypothetical protein
MTSENKTWESLKAGYLQQVREALSSAGHPRSEEIIEDVRSHLDRRFAELEADWQTWENFQAIITEMGPASDYVELLNTDRMPTRQKVSLKYLFWVVLIFAAIAAVTYLFLLSDDETNIIVPGKRVGVYTLGMSKDDVLKSLGKPKAIFYGEEKYTLNNLPRTYFMMFDDISFEVIEDSVEGITVLSPFYKFTNGLGVGDSEQQIIKSFGSNFYLQETEVKDFLTYKNKGLVFEINKDKRDVMEINVSKTADSPKPTCKSNEQVEGEGYLKNVKFKIIDEATGEPLKNRELNICYFVMFKLKPGAPSPYLDKGADWFITAIKTDGQGIFFLDLSSIRIADIVVELGKPYNIVRFGRSSDLAHTNSADHIRVVQFEMGTTRVTSNMIYDLKQKTIKTIPISGQPEEKPYEEILLLAKRLKESSSKSTVQVEEIDDKEQISILVEQSDRRSSEDPSTLVRQAAADGRISYKLTTPDEFKAIVGQPTKEWTEDDGGIIWMEYHGIRARFFGKPEIDTPHTILQVLCEGKWIDIGQDRPITLRYEEDLDNFGSFWGYSGVDLSRLDLSRKGELLKAMPFDSLTVWPESDRLPPDFDPKAVMEWGKYPGLRVNQLHERGVTGKGVHVAIIDQPLLVDHIEYRDQLASYTDIQTGNVGPAMHGAAVASLLVGKTCGTAPGAILHFWAEPSWKMDYKYRCTALEQIIQFNEGKEKSEQIRILSVSKGFSPGEPNLDRWKTLLEKAKQAGIYVIHCSKMGSGTGCQYREDSDNPSNYKLGAFYKGGPIYDEPSTFFTPIDNRTMASPKGKDVYTFYISGGLSWGAPYIAGVVALGMQVNPDLSVDQIDKLLYGSGWDFQRGKLINPIGFVEAARDDVDQTAEMSERMEESRERGQSGPNKKRSLK